MLQQTRVATVLPYYERWMRRFPTADELSRSDDEEIMAHWQGLGYYRRCRGLVAGVRAVQGGKWPTSREEWGKLPGIGPYTSAALASICNGERSAVVDGNVERVFARLTGSQSTGDRRRKQATAWADDLIAPEDPATWNQAIMELGATVCTPRNPSCGQCPFDGSCVARRDGRTGDLPRPNPRPEVTDVLQPVVVPVCGDDVGLIRAASGQWWAGLWRFPFPEEAPQGEDVALGRISHSVTRYRLHLDVVLRRCGGANQLRWVPPSGLESLPMPSAMRKVWRLAAEYTPPQCCSV